MAAAAGQENSPTGPVAVVIATVHWASTTRLCLALAEGGFEVMALVPAHHALRHLHGVQTRTIGRTRAQAARSIMALLESRPVDLVMPADERAIDLLHITYRRALDRKGASHRRIAELIEESLGSASAFTMGKSKSRFIELAREEGVRVPDTRTVHGLGELRGLLAERRFPLVLKQDESFGGLAVRIVRDASEAERSFLELRASESRYAALKEALRKLDPGLLVRRDRPISLQHYIAGRPANRAVACDRGRVLAGLSVEVLESCNATGPATVVRVVDRDDMAEAAARIVARLHLSGLIGFDFMLEEATGRAYLLEMNVRPTQICHLALGEDSDMIAALAGRRGAVAVRRPLPTLPERTVALYPQELWRDPQSSYLVTAFHDVPWHVPRFIDAYREPLAPEPPDWVQLVRRHLRRLRQLWERAPAEERLMPSRAKADLIRMKA